MNTRMKVMGAIALGTTLLLAAPSTTASDIRIQVPIMLATSEDMDLGRELLDEREYEAAAEAYQRAVAQATAEAAEAAAAAGAADAPQAAMEAVRAAEAQAAAAMYWQAYSLERSTRYVDAQQILMELRTQYAASRWADDAEVLRYEIEERLGRGDRHYGAYDDEHGDTRHDQLSDQDELRMYAIQALLNADPERAIPVLERILSGDYPVREKQQALFVLSQSGDGVATDIIVQIIRDGSDPELQVQAAHMLMFGGTDTDMVALYDEATNSRIKRALLEASMTSGNTDLLVRAARDRSDTQVQVQAIHMLGASGASNMLEELYDDDLPREAKLALLDAFGMSGDPGPLEAILRSESDPEIRQRALRSFGIIGGDIGDLIVGIYDRLEERQEKRAAIEALMMQGDSAALRALYHQEEDPGLKRHIVQMLTMTGDDESTDLLLEILEEDP
jgi:hypothetical protein